MNTPCLVSMDRRPTASALVAALAITGLGGVCPTVRAQWVTWERSAGGNGHRYQAFPGFVGLTWTVAEARARAEGGYLATITSPAENAFVFALVDAPQFWRSFPNGSGPALGGLQPPGSPEPGGGWRWATGEPWSYSNWRPGQPDNGRSGPPEDRLHFFSGLSGARAATWNDLPSDDPNIGGYVVEADPTCYADCDTSTGPGTLDIFDFLCFQNRFDAGDPYACDCDTFAGRGICDVFDLLCFQNTFVAGCP